MNIGRPTNGNSDHKNETNENAMYNTPPIVGLSPHLAGQNVTYRLRSELNDSSHRKSYSQGDRTATEFTLEEREFYKSYDPNVGLHTAAVLGGILVLLILFLLYKTKCRKAARALIKHIRQKQQKLKDQEEAMGKSVQSIIEPMCSSSSGKNAANCESSGCGQQLCTTNDCCADDSHTVPVIDVVDTSCAVDTNEVMQTDIPTFNISGPSPSTSPAEEDESYQTLPVLETDIAAATAMWVQDMPLASQSFNDIAGAVTQVQPTLTKSVQQSGSCPLQTVSNTGLSPLPFSQTWNKSLPLLSKSISLTCDRVQSECEDQSKEEGRRKRNPQNLTIAIPGASELSTSAKLHVHSPVPFPVTPTVTIQNFTSKGNSQHSSLQRDSNGSVTSNSSDDLLLVPSSSSLSWKCQTSKPSGKTGGATDSCEMFSDSSKSSQKPRALSSETKF